MSDATVFPAPIQGTFLDLLAQVAEEVYIPGSLTTMADRILG